MFGQKVGCYLISSCPSRFQEYASSSKWRFLDQILGKCYFFQNRAAQQRRDSRYMRVSARSWGYLCLALLSLFQNYAHCKHDFQKAEKIQNSCTLSEFIVKCRDTLRLPVVQTAHSSFRCVYNCLTLRVFPHKCPASQSDYWTVYFHVSSDNLKHLYSYIQVVTLVENHKDLLQVDLAVL